MQISTSGKLGELKIIIKLLEFGWDVYEPIIDNNGIDVVIIKDSVVYTIQIKSAYSTGKGNRYSFRFGNNGNNADYVIAFCDGRYYIIPSKEFSSTSFFLFPNGKSRLLLYKDNWTFRILH